MVILRAERCSGICRADGKVILSDKIQELLEKREKRKRTGERRKTIPMSWAVPEGF